jgi:hypothetical protein
MSFDTVRLSVTVGRWNGRFGEVGDVPHVNPLCQLHVASPQRPLRCHTAEINIQSAYYHGYNYPKFSCLYRSQYFEKLTDKNRIKKKSRQAKRIAITDTPMQ